MNFNEKQTKEIYEFIKRYNADEEFKNSVQKLYDNNTYKLSITNIYALEEVLRYGTKKIFNKFLEAKGTYSEEKAIDLYDGFIELLSKDMNFKQYKMQQLKETPETLSAMEIFAFALISSSDNQKEKMTDKLEYDQYNPILYSTDNQIRETLTNLFFGEFIYQILELPSMKPIKVRQKENGRIANIDKPFIIKKIQNAISNQSSIFQLQKAIDVRFVEVKMNLLLGKEEKAFEKYLKFNTNISSNEIFGIEKDNSATDMYNFLMNIINMKKEKDNEKTKK